MVWPLNDVTELAELFADVATTDPLSALLLAVGAVLVAVSAGGFGVLTVGAALDAIVPETPGREPPREA